MPVRKYSDIYRLADLRNPERPLRPIPSERPISIFDFLGETANGASNTVSAYQNAIMSNMKRKEAEQAMKDAEQKRADEQAARQGRNKFRQSLIDGKQITTKTEVVPGNGPGDAENPFKYKTETKREDLSPKEMVDSYMRNVPMQDDADAKGMLGLLIDKNKPASMKMKEMTDGFDAELRTRIEEYKVKNNGQYPTRDVQEQMAFEIGGTPYAKLVKQATSMETSFDNRKQTGIENQRIVGNRQAEERLGLMRQNYDLQVGKDFRADQQEFGKKLVDLQAVETHLAPVEKKIASGKVDMLSSKVFSGNWGQLAQNLAGEDPELSSELGYLAAAYIKMISGAAVNEGEAIRLLGTVGVNVWSTPEKMKAGIQGMRNELNAKQNILDNSYDRIVDHYRGKNQNPTAPTKTPVATPSAAPKKKSADDYLNGLGL